MQLTEEQRAKVQQWIGDGAKLSEIQDRLGREMDIRLTYMDVRLLVDDLELTPKDPVEPEPVKPAEVAEVAGGDPVAGTGEPLSPDSPVDESLDGASSINVSIDQITRAGAMVSGKVTFSDGKNAEWYLDQYGRFGFQPEEPGYRPAQADLEQFNLILDRELRKLGI
jgi:hypothetical protein